MDCGRKAKRCPNPRESANFISAYFYFWLWKIFRRGMKKEMEIEDLFEPLKEHRSDYLGDRFESLWKTELNTRKSPSLLRVITKQFLCSFLLYNIATVAMEFLGRLLQPIFLGRLIRYFEPGSDMSEEEAYLNALWILVGGTISVLARQPVSMAMAHIGMKMRVATCSLIYRKSLRLSQAAASEATVGQIVNLMSNDATRFDDCVNLLAYLVVGPVQALIVTYFLWDSMGISAVFGMFAILIFIPLQGFIGKKIAVQRLRSALRTDERVRLMNEVISSIQMIKMHVWELPMAKLIAATRLNEIREIAVTSYLRAAMGSFTSVANSLTLFVTVCCYVLLGNVIKAEKVFVVMSLFSIVNITVALFVPRAIYAAAEALVSIRRIEKFLLCEELEASTLSSLQTCRYGDVALSDASEEVVSKSREDEPDVDGSPELPSITVVDAMAKWSAEYSENTLTSINMRVTSHQLLAVIGPVGSSKTSLLLTLLRELPLTSGSVAVKGRISYASQEPWLFARSVRNNILFGEPYERHRYQQVVKACALTRDFELLPYGDRTVVGDRGISLSGGQKARINLARAVYKQADIYMLDDPLSAVDAHVGRHLFENCICGLLKDKIRILVTHQLQFLSHVDHIVILNEGRMEAHGTYSQLQENGLDFAKLLEDQESDVSGDESVKRGAGNVLHRSVSRRRRKRNLSVGSSASFTETISIENAPLEDAQEMRTRGTISLSTYRSILLASRRYILVVVFLSSELAFLSFDIGTNYWLTFWTNMAGERLLGDSTTNNTTNGTALDTFSNSTYTSVLEESSLISRDLRIYIFAALVIASIVFVLFATFLFFFLCIESSVNLHNNMFGCVIRLPMRFFNANPSGQILSRFSKDMGIVDEQLPILISECLKFGIMMLRIVILISVVNFWILLPTALVIVVFYYCRSIYMHTSRTVKRLEGISHSPVISHLNASLQGLTTIRSSKAEKLLHEEFDRHQDLHSSAFYLFLSSSRAFAFCLEFVCLFYIACVTLSFVILGQGSLGGSVGMAISQSLVLTGTFQWFMRQSAEMENHMTSVERVLEYGSLEDEGELESAPEKKPPEEWPLQGRIVFRNVSLSYAVEEPPVLKNIDLTIYPSEKVGIVGRTGAGKTSLIAALFRLARVEGSILIDDVDTNSIGLHDLRSKISVIPQEPVVFSRSLRKNLDPFDEYSDIVIWNALREVEMKEAVQELPDRLDHKMAEGGSNFSVGQRQLLCLARVIVRKNKILVMDEATANIDPGTDALIQEKVRRKFADCTVLTIAHRLVTVMDSDRVLVLDAGQVVEFDHPHVLLQKKSGFLWNMVQETGKSMAESLLNTAEKNYEERGLKKAI